MSVTWNGSTITGPVLIYLDEILVDSYNTTDIGDPNRPGALICKSENRGSNATWHFADGVLVSIASTSSTTTFKQIRAREGMMSRLSLSRRQFAYHHRDIYVRFNGAWHCRLNAIRNNIYYTVFDQQINVGIFVRGEGMFAS